VQRTHEARVTKITPAADAPKTRALVAVERAEPPYFRCVHTPWREHGDGVEIAQEAAEHLGVAGGAKVWVLPLE
jgi:hypothetical protein